MIRELYNVRIYLYSNLSFDVPDLVILNDKIQVHRGDL